MRKAINNRLGIDIMITKKGKIKVNSIKYNNDRKYSRPIHNN